ncbi:uncharacterized protein LOC144283625 [Canis aureus]
MSVSAVSPGNTAHGNSDPRAGCLGLGGTLNLGAAAARGCPRRAHLNPLRTAPRRGPEPDPRNLRSWFRCGLPSTSTSGRRSRWSQDTAKTMCRHTVYMVILPANKNNVMKTYEYLFL